MDPNRPHKTKTPRPPVTVRNIFSTPPGLSQSGIGIIANDSLRRQSGEVTTSSTPTFTGMNRILGFTPSSRNTVSVPRMSIPSFNHDVMSSSGYQLATPPVHSQIISEPSVYGIPTDVTIHRYYVKAGGGACGGSGGNGDTSGDASVSLETPMNLSNHAFSLNNQNREMNSDIGEFNESYNTAMNASELEPLQGIPPENGHYGQNPELQQQRVSWIYSPHQPNLQHLERMGSNMSLGSNMGVFMSPPPPPADVLRPDSAQQPPPHFFQHGHASPASNYNPLETYQSPGYTWNEPRQYSMEEQANLQRLNQGSHDRVQEEYIVLEQHSGISNDDVNTQYLTNTPAALPLESQLLSSENDRSHFHELPLPSPEQLTRSVIMHTKNLVSSSLHPDEKLAEPPVIPAAEVKRQSTLKRKRGAPKKPKVPLPQSEFVEVMDLVCTRAKVKDPNPYPFGRDTVNPNVQNETEVTNELIGGETSDALTDRANLFTQLPLGPGSVDQGGDLRIMPVCPIVTPVPSNAVVTGEVPLPEIRAPAVFPPKQRKPKPSPTTQRKARRSNTKPNDYDTAQTQPAKGRRTKKVPKKEFDHAQMEGPVFKHAVGAVLGKDAAKSCEEEQEKATNSSEKAVASSDVVSLMELASKLPDTTVPLKRWTDAEVLALINSTRNATGTTPVKLLKPEEDSNATSISTVEQLVESKGELKTEENESEYETDGGTIRLKKRVRKSTTNVSGSTSRNRTRRRVSLDVTSGSDSGGDDDDDYTPRTTRSKSAKGKSVSSSSGLSATGIDSDSRSSAGKRRKSRDSHFEETLGVDTASATIKQEVEEDEDDSVMEAERQTFEELIKQEAEMNNGASKASAGSSNRKPIQMPMSGVRRHAKTNQFRKLKKSVGRPRLKENRIRMQEESSDDVQVVPSQGCFLDDSTSSSPRKRGRGRNKKVFDFSCTTGENVDNDYGVEGEGESSKFFHYRRPTYSEEETKALYGNMKFVLDVRDIDKDPSNICIWQILEAKFCLRRYFPCKFGQQQFYHSSPQHWYFAEEEFRNEEFYDRFQPVAINEANTQKHFAEGWIMEETIIQYPYVDKSFFNRMVKNVGKLGNTDRLRGILTKAMPLFIMQILQPSYLSDLQRVKQEGLIMLDPKLEEQLDAWDILEKVIRQLLSAFCTSSKCVFNQETLYLLQTFPKMRYSNKSVNKEVHCSACSPKSARTPMVKVVFNTKLGCGTPYDIHTLVEHPNLLKPENDTEYWCRNCSMTAKKFHRLAHFRYSLYRIMRQNLAKDVAMFKEYDVPITDQCLLMINDVDVNWRYTVFLDLQLSMAEVDAECDPTSSPSTT